VTLDLRQERLGRGSGDGRLLGGLVLLVLLLLLCLLGGGASAGVVDVDSAAEAAAASNLRFFSLFSFLLSLLGTSTFSSF
jgi:hypothetical protein